MRHVAAYALLLVCLVLSPSPSAWAQDEQSDGRFPDVMLKVRQLLIDPDSAQFRGLRTVINSKGDEAVCGEVNGRNRFGGFAGFRRFSFSDDEPNIVDPERAETDYRYRMAGCAGPQGEMLARYEDEATFNCTVIWTMLLNTIVEKQTEHVALDAAMNATKGRAAQNGVSLPEPQLAAIREQYAQSLRVTLAEKKQVKAIEKSPVYQGQVFVQTCKLKTVEMFKAQTAR